MWMRQLRLLFFFSMDSQVLLQAVVKMMKDVANWFMLVVFLLLAFTSALYVLFRDQGTWTDTKNTAGAEYPMDECDQTNVPFSKWEVGFQLLVEGAFASQVAFDCVWKTDRRELAVTLLPLPARRAPWRETPRVTPSPPPPPLPSRPTSPRAPPPRASAP